MAYRDASQEGDHSVPEFLFISRDRVAYDIRILNFAAYRDASREGEGKGEKREKRLPYGPDYESLQGVSSCCAKTHRRAFHMTPDLTWHGQQQPYSSSLYVLTEYSTSVNGIYRISSSRLSVSLRIPTY